jgi:hypothetical protein
MGGDDQFRLRTLLLCFVIFITLSLGHLAALAVQGGVQAGELEEQIEGLDLNDPFRDELEAQLDDMENISFWDVLGGFGDILFGLDLPMPWPVVVSVFNGLLLLTIAILVWSYIKAMIPFISG